MSTALGFAGFTDGTLTGQGRWIAYQSAHTLIVDTETATNPINTGENTFDNKATVNDLVTENFAITWDMLFVSHGTVREATIALINTVLGGVSQVQFDKTNNADDTVVQLFDAGGHIARGTLTMPISTTHHLTMIGNRSDSTLTLNGTMALVHHNPNPAVEAYQAVQLELVAIDSSVESIKISNMTIADPTPASATKSIPPYLILQMI